MTAICSITFDLDGTLVDSVPDLCSACNLMLNEMGEEPYSADTISTFVGKGVAHLVKCCLSRTGTPDEAKLSQGLEIFSRYYQQTNGTASTLYPGVYEGLKKWQLFELPMGVVTNKPAAFTEPLLQRLGIFDAFAAIVSGDTASHRKPHPEPIHHACRSLGSTAQENLHIGDSHHDIAASRAAGCTIWCVPYGYHGGSPLKPTDCDVLVDDLYAAADLFESKFLA